jgi:hypothetical protein
LLVHFRWRPRRQALWLQKAQTQLENLMQRPQDPLSQQAPRKVKLWTVGKQQMLLRQRAAAVQQRAPQRAKR